MTSPPNDSDDETAVDVLVVDDDRDAANELVEFLSRASLTCVAAGNGWAALQLVAEGCRPAVVVSDLRMPELDGLEFVDRLDKIPGLKRPEIIFVSGNAGYDDVIAAIRLGARDILTKPIDGLKLVQAVKLQHIAHQTRARSQPASPGQIAEPARNAAADPIDRKRAVLDDLKAMKRLRSQYFPSDLFSDPCWEMLLDLYDAFLGGAEVTVTSLCVASGVPQSTALRRLETLKQHGLVVRTEDEDDRRRCNIRFTDAGLAAVERFFKNFSACHAA
jgi:CheY-like chemotaxis protein/DNA-binding MarR family transcriptional regulator